ncbi:MAG: GNAT family N-acetyltransferase [Anaerolineae bacterium]|nr:hypothetical protein [Thermoflexales bacterium]MDW8396243.1 GNAT family N-acetyltransferase [Anaerolineae bacterium]
MSQSFSRSIIPATRSLRRVLRGLFELYAHDLSPHTGAEVSPQGRYTDEDFLRHWHGNLADGIRPFLLQVDGQWAGFAWVGQGSYVAPGSAQRWLMEEFFILRKYRRQGHGTWFASQLFAQFPDEWEVGELATNLDAQQFWRATIQRLVGTFDEVWVNNERWQGLVQIFRIASPASAVPRSKYVDARRER